MGGLIEIQSGSDSVQIPDMVGCGRICQRTSRPSCFGQSMPLPRLSNLFLTVSCSIAICLGASFARGETKPNVVIVITDDQGYGDLSCHGNPVLKTPNLDALHADSVRLVDYHVAPTCSPTRAAFLTGHWTNRTGVWHTIMGRSMLRENEVTMGQVFIDMSAQRRSTRCTTCAKARDTDDE